MHNTNHIKEITALLDKARVDKQLNNIITAIHKHINEALESVVPDELISYDIMILRDLLELQQLKKHLHEQRDYIYKFGDRKLLELLSKYRILTPDIPGCCVNCYKSLKRESKTDGGAEAETKTYW